MEIVIVEKKTFEALLAAAETLAGKVGELCRRCSDKRESKWLAHKPANLADLARQPEDRLRAGEP